MGHVHELIMAWLPKHQEITWGVRTKEKGKPTLNFIKLEKLVASHKIDETFYFYQKIYFIYFLIIIFEKQKIT